MTSATQASSAVSSRYANALMDLAHEAKKLDKVEKDLVELCAMIEKSEDLALLIRSPLVNARQQGQALAALAAKAKFQDITVNFLGVLARNRRLNAVEAIAQAFQDELAHRRGEITVNVQTAQDLTAKQKKDLETSLSKAMGSGVLVRAEVKPDIMGGMIVTVGSHMIDDSVARKLERLRVAMGSQSNENEVSNISEVG